MNFMHECPICGQECLIEAKGINNLKEAASFEEKEQVKFVCKDCDEWGYVGNDDPRLKT